MSDNLKVDRASVPPPTEEEIKKLLLVAHDGYGKIYGHKTMGIVARDWWGTLMQVRVYIFASTGCRVSESVFLKRKHFDFEKKMVYIIDAYTPSGKPKNRSGRTQGLSETACNFLSKAFDKLELQPEDYVMSGSSDFIKTDAVRVCLKSIATAAGLNPYAIFPHIFRVNMGTRISDKYGYVAAAEVLGHHDRGITVMQHYTRHAPKKQRDMTSKILDDFL